MQNPNCPPLINTLKRLISFSLQAVHTQAFVCVNSLICMLFLTRNLTLHVWRKRWKNAIFAAAHLTLFTFQGQELSVLLLCISLYRFPSRFLGLSLRARASRYYHMKALLVPLQSISEFWIQLRFWFLSTSLFSSFAISGSTQKCNEYAIEDRGIAKICESRYTLVDLENMQSVRIYTKCFIRFVIYKIFSVSRWWYKIAFF